MNIIQLKKNVIFIMILLLSSFIVLAGCGRYELFVPQYKNFTPPPDQVAIEQLISDYMTDEVAADAKYKGNTYVFTEIEVEKVGNTINTYPPSFSDIFIISGSAIFTPRSMVDFDLIGEGFVVDIIGECKGWQFTRVLITDCWVGVVKGDVASLPNEFEY